MKNYLYFGLLLLSISLNGCKDDSVDHSEDLQQQQDFLNTQIPGIYQGKEIIWCYDVQLHQIAYSDKSYRIQTDAQDKYLHFRLTELPGPDKETDLSLTVQGIPAIESGSYPVKTLKLDNKLVWLWNSGESKGFLIRLE